MLVAFVCWRFHVPEHFVEQNEPRAPLKIVALIQWLVRKTSFHDALPLQEAGARRGLSVPNVRYLGRG
jgi:hypothetical protein